MTLKIINNITSSIFYDIEKNDYEFFLVNEGYLEENFFFLIILNFLTL